MTPCPQLLHVSSRAYIDPLTTPSQKEKKREKGKREEKHLGMAVFFLLPQSGAPAVHDGDPA